ncbi:PREDICTED: signal-regulatory protein gamma-like [Gekko japonicus]|uniref:Signal-regulatory protein gamma-like n=1 Tax=Gekko japonicus TaxID=146911 RepID=A0ABM1KGV4_GEKJA|nr:PREDICTED: signal-regulatory protein gamma-like [Gekko japonicus]
MSVGWDPRELTCSFPPPATPSQPSIVGPPSRVDAGASGTFTCTSDGFFPRDITVTWLKEGRAIPASRTTTLPPRESTSYRVVSAVEVSLTEKDVKSELTCQIQHNTLTGPLRQSFRLGDALRVAPKLSMEPSHLVNVIVNQLVTIACSAKGFYPNDTSLVWRENGSETDLGTPEPLTQETDGTFSVKSSLEVNTTEQRNHSVFTCYAMRNSQILDHVNVMLKIHRGKGDSSSANTGPWLSFNPGLWVAFVVNKIVATVFLSFLFLRKMFSKTNKTRQRQPRK